MRNGLKLLSLLIIFSASAQAKNNCSANHLLEEIFGKSGSYQSVLKSVSKDQSALTRTPKPRVETPVEGLYESIPTETETTLANGITIRKKKNGNTTVHNSEGEQIAFFDRRVDTDTKTLHINLDKVAKKRGVDAGNLPSFLQVPGVKDLVPGRGVPSQVFIGLREMKLSNVPYGGLKHSVTSNIENVRTVLDLFDAPPVRKWLLQNPTGTVPYSVIAEAIPYTHTGQYLNTIFTQSGHRISKIHVEKGNGFMHSAELEELLNLWKVNDDVAKRAVVKEVRDGKIIPYAPTQEMPYGFIIRFDLEPLPASMSTAERVKNNFFETSRGIDIYERYLGEGFRNDLQKLNENAHWIDMGSGDGRAIYEYLTGQHPYDPKKHRKLPAELKEIISRPAKSKASITGVSFAKPVNIVSGSKVTYKHGRYFEKIPLNEFSKANLITDFYGVFSYTEDVSLVLDRYLKLLKDDGSIYLYGDWHNTEVILRNSRISLLEWLKEVKGIHAEANAGEVIKIKRIPHERFSVPNLELVEITHGSPPKRVFKLADPFEAPLITTEELQKVEAWFKDPHLPREVAAEKAFNLYWEKRTSYLSKDERQKLEKKLVSRKEIEEQTINGNYHIRKEEISLQLPRELKRSTLYYQTLVHEVEHAIQFGENKGTHLKSLGKWSFGRSKVLHESEKGAMTAEWNYLRTVPVETRKKMIAEVREMDALSIESQERVIRMMENADLPLLEYLHKEWNAGRYSLKAIRDDTYHTRERPVFIGSIVAGTLVLSLRGGCVSIKNNGNQNKSEYYKHFCKKFMD